MKILHFWCLNYINTLFYSELGTKGCHKFIHGTNDQKLHRTLTHFLFNIWPLPSVLSHNVRLSNANVIFLSHPHYRSNILEKLQFIGNSWRDMNVCFVPLEKVELNCYLGGYEYQCIFILNAYLLIFTWKI